MDIKIIGPGCKNCKKLQENVEQAIAALGMTATVSKVEDMAEIVKTGVLKTPGLMIDDQVVISGRVAKPKEIMQLLQK